MPQIAGIIHPSSSQITDLMGSIRKTFAHNSSFKFLRHKNLEMGSLQSPLVSNDRKTIWAALDGQIHNAAALREELHKQLGFTFTTETDEEVLVYAYDAWKEQFVERLQGPFALAIFDEQKEYLFLAIDRLGQKPLYWTAQRDFWIFSNQVKVLLATGAVPQTPSVESLASYLYFGFVPQDLSGIRGVNKLLPGHFLTVDLKRQVIIDQYWSYSKSLEISLPISNEEARRQLGTLMDASICDTLPQNSKVATFLLGTLGSSAVSWFLTHHQSRDKIQGCSAVFDEPKSSELVAAQELAKTLELTHQFKNITPEEVIQDLPAIVWHLDEPIADPYVIQTWHLAKLAAKECSCAFSDTGWKEMFGGSKSYFEGEHAHSHTELAFHLSRLPSFLRDKCVLPVLGLFSRRFKYRVLRNIDLNREQLMYLMDSSLFHGKERKKVSPLLYKAFDPEVFTQRFHRLTPLAGNINPSLYYDAKTKLPDSSLYQYERLSEAHSLNLVTPYLHPPLVDFLATLPEETKFEEGQPAGILRSLMKQLCHYPLPFIEQESTFLETWRHNPLFRDLFSSLQYGRLEDEGLISRKWIKQQLSYPYIIPKTFRQLWALVVLETWFRLFINRPIEGAPPTLSAIELFKT